MQAKKLYFILFISFLLSCTGCKSDFAKNNNVPDMRIDPNPKAIASYMVPMGDPKLDRRFGVEVFETPFTFKYLLSMQYDGMTQSDSLILPVLNTWPTVIVKPGPDKLSCIIGFLDEKKNFMEYKLLSAKNNQLILKKLKSYELK